MVAKNPDPRNPIPPKTVIRLERFAPDGTITTQTLSWDEEMEIVFRPRKVA